VTRRSIKIEKINSYLRYIFLIFRNRHGIGMFLYNKQLNEIHLSLNKNCSIDYYQKIERSFTKLLKKITFYPNSNYEVFRS
jgi:hypothetical protein